MDQQSARTFNRHVYLKIYNSFFPKLKTQFWCQNFLSVTVQFARITLIRLFDDLRPKFWAKVWCCFRSLFYEKVAVLHIYMYEYIIIFMSTSEDPNLEFSLHIGAEILRPTLVLLVIVVVVVIIVVGPVEHKASMSTAHVHNATQSPYPSLFCL